MEMVAMKNFEEVDSLEKDQNRSLKNLGATFTTDSGSEISSGLITNSIIFFKDTQSIKWTEDKLYGVDTKKFNNTDLNLLANAVFSALRKHIAENLSSTDLVMEIKSFVDTRKDRVGVYTIILLAGTQASKYLTGLQRFAKQVALGGIDAHNLFNPAPADSKPCEQVKKSISEVLGKKSGHPISRPFSFGINPDKDDEEIICNRFNKLVQRQSSDDEKHKLLVIPNGFNDLKNEIYCTVPGKGDDLQSQRKLTLSCHHHQHFKVMADAFCNGNRVLCNITASIGPYKSSWTYTLNKASLVEVADSKGFKLETQ